jgi:hypothetical protein
MFLKCFPLPTRISNIFGQFLSTAFRIAYVASKSKYRLALSTHGTLF